MKTIYLFLGSIFSLLIPIKGLLLLILIMVLIDTIYAIYVSIITKGLSSFKSALLRKGMTPKLLGYIGSTILLYSIDVMFFSSVILGVKFLLSKSIAMIWIYNESKSIDENSQKMGNRPFCIVAKEAIRFFSKAKKEVKEIIEEEK